MEGWWRLDKGIEPLFWRLISAENTGQPEKRQTIAPCSLRDCNIVNELLEPSIRTLVTKRATTHDAQGNGRTLSPTAVSPSSKVPEQPAHMGSTERPTRIALDERGVEHHAHALEANSIDRRPEETLPAPADILGVEEDHGWDHGGGTQPVSLDERRQIGISRRSDIKIGRPPDSTLSTAKSEQTPHFINRRFEVENDLTPRR